jgi:hypothetical protein
MDELKMGKIALVLLKDRADQEGLRLAGLERDLGNVAKRTGLVVSELKEFTKIILSEAIEKHLK